MNSLPIFEGRLAIQQRVLPAYRAAFLDLLDSYCHGGLVVFAGQPLSEENVTPASGLRAARYTAAQNINFLRTTSPFFQCWQKGLLEWLENWQPDVLVVEANPRTRSTLKAVRWMHARGRPVLGWGLGLPPVKGPFQGWRNANRLLFLRQLDGMIAYSHKGARDYIQACFDPGVVFVAPNAVSPRPTWEMPARPTNLLDKPLVLFVGRLQKRKRVDFLFQACAALPDELQPRLWVVGDGPARQEFEAAALKIYPQAVFLGSRHGEELAGLFCQADLFVLPGSGGLAVQQAMSYGLPVIVAEGDGTQGDLVHPENGWLLPPNDQPALQAALQEAVKMALEDAPALRRKGEASFRRVVEEFNLEKMAQSFVLAANRLRQAKR
jgi:glycosyltransferase involved in cell wall biosynthesis